MASCTKQNLDY